MTAPLGLVVYDGPSCLPGEANNRIVAILTGVARPSGNGKVGDMLQLWILPAGENPWAAKASGGDSAVCGTCPLRDGRCYVSLMRGPAEVWRAWQAGRYLDGQQLDAAGLAAAALARPGVRGIRFGAWGDPAALPIEVLARLVDACHARRLVHAGYTHAWREPSTAPYQRYLMASTEDEAGRLDALARGWRTFYVMPTDAPVPPDGARWCPAAPEGGASRTCATCGLCGGGERGPSIAIRAHGNAVAASVWRARARQESGAEKIAPTA